MLSDKLSVTDLQQLFEKMEKKLAQHTNILTQRTTQKVIRISSDLLINYSQETDYQTLQLYMANLISKYPALSSILGYEKSGWLFFNAGKLKGAVEQWDKLDHKPQEYFWSKAELSSNISKKIYWLYNGKLYDKIANISKELKNSAGQIKKLSEEDHHIVAKSLIHLGDFNNALLWYQENGFLGEAFNISKVHWHKLENREEVLEQFFSSLLSRIKKEPIDENLNLAEDTVKFIQRHLPWETGGRLIQNYWNILLQIRKWMEVLESFKKLRREYRTFGHKTILDVIARNADTEDKTIPKKDMANFIFEFYHPNELQNWIKQVPIELISSVIERTTNPPDSLKWYENIESMRTLPTNQRRFVQLRWLKVKSRRLQHLSENKEWDRHKYEYGEYEKKQKLWKISPYKVNRELEYPSVPTGSEEEMIPPIQIEWDGKNCMLSFKGQIVLINVAESSITGFKVDVVKESRPNRIDFSIRAWGIKGEILNNQFLNLFFQEKPWKSFEIKRENK